MDDFKENLDVFKDGTNSLLADHLITTGSLGFFAHFLIEFR